MCTNYLKTKRIVISFIFLLAVPCSVYSESRIDALLAPSTSKKYEHVRVEKVVRADTFILESGEYVRLIGVDAPDPPKPERVPTDPYGFPVKQEVNPIVPVSQQSYEFVRNLLEDQYVRLEFDAQRISDHQTLAYVFLKDGTFLNEEILKEGFANLKTIPPNTKYVERLKKAYQEARREKRGLQNE